MQKYRQAAEEAVTSEPTPKVRLALIEDQHHFEDPMGESGISSLRDMILRVLDDLGVKLAFVSTDKTVAESDKLADHFVSQRVDVLSPKSTPEPITVIKSPSVRNHPTDNLMLDMTTLFALISNLTHFYPTR